MRNVACLLGVLCFFLVPVQGKLQTELNPEPIVQFGHPGLVINDIVMSPDNQVMATSDGEYLKLWDISSQLELRSFRAEEGSISHIDFTETGDTLHFTADRYRYTFSVLTGKRLQRVDLFEDYQKLKLEEGEDGTPEFILNGRFGRNDEREEDPSLYNYVLNSPYSDLRAGIRADDIVIFRGEEGEEEFVQVITPDRAGGGNQGGQFNIQDFYKLQRGETDDIDWVLLYTGTSLTFSPDNQSILIDSTLYSIESGYEILTFSPHSYGLSSMDAQFMPNSSDLIFYGQPIPSPEEPEQEEDTVNDEASVLDALRELLKSVYNLNRDSSETVLFAYAESGEIISGGEMAGVQEAFFLKGHPYFVTGHADNSVYLWDYKNATRHSAIHLKVDDAEDAALVFGITDLVQTVDDKYLLVACAGSVYRDRLTMWDISSGQRIGNFGAEAPPIDLEVRPSKSDSIVVQEYKDYLFPLEELNLREYGSYRILSLTDGQAPAIFPKFDSIVFSPRLDYYLTKQRPDEEVEVYQSIFNEMTATLRESSRQLQMMSFSNDAQYVAGFDGKDIIVWSVADNIILHTIEQKNSWEILDLNFSEDDKFLICSYEPTSLRFYSLDDPSEVYYQQKADIKDKGVYLSRRAAVEVLRLKNSLLKLLDKTPVPVPDENGKVERSAFLVLRITKLLKSAFFQAYYDVELSPEGRYAAAWRDDLASVQFIDLEAGEKLALVVDESVKMQNFTASQLGAQMNNQGSGVLIQSFFRDRTAFRPRTAISPNWEYLAVATKHKPVDKNFLSTILPVTNLFSDADDNESLVEVDEYALLIKVIPITNTTKRIRLSQNDDIPGVYFLEESEDYGEGIIYSPDGAYIAASSNSLNTIRIWHADDGTIYRTLEGHSGKIAFTSNGKTLVSSGWDRQIKVWDIEADQEIYSFIAIEGQNDYINILPNNYYCTSRANSGAIAFAYGKDAYPFDQFDLQFQRRDLVLREMKKSIQESEDFNDNFIEALYACYEMRLDRAGLSEEDFDDLISLPVLEVDEHPFTSDSRNFTINLNAKDLVYPLHSLTVTINGVPVLKNGKKLISVGPGERYQEAVSFKLSEGENHLQVFVTNKNKLSSLKYDATILYTGEKEDRVLHIVTLGANEFGGRQPTLVHAIKDLEDFNTIYGEREEQFDKVIRHNYQGENFSKENLSRLARELEETNPDDVVVCYVSTHGHIDAATNRFYLVTPTMDVSNPANNGISYQLFESFLRRISARNKVAFIDACNSGEIYQDDEDQEPSATTLSSQPKVADTKQRTYLDNQETLDLMKEYFVDLRVTTGATVFASSSAIQYSIDSGEEWDNSPMMYCLLKALREQVADTNNDKVTTVTEMIHYLSYKVPSITGNKHRPLCRSENVFNNFHFWDQESR